MNSLENAYQVIADVLAQAARHDVAWEFLQMKAPVLGMNMGGDNHASKIALRQ